ncbi:MAG: phosphate ABC transporter ATP-binding protein [Methanotrichaceae archaeon]|nr:phosphate ABC transporter ATP-binding protein [Methanotrichaceae archaeon]
MALLEIRELSKSYSKAEILSDINLSVEKGTILALIGPTGSGKTTLLRIIDLLDELTSGQLIFDGIDLTEKSEREKLKARRRMAMVFQKPMMFRSNVLENVKYGLKIRGLKGKDKGLSALKSVGLAGYESRDANTLSGGEMQRLALARAIAVEPELLLLDEPTANLDPKSSALIEELILAWSKQGITVIMATHNMAQCRRLADIVAVLVQGKIVEMGRPEGMFYRPRNNIEIIKEDGFIRSESAPW